jgi:hypothetical protein
MQAIQAQSIALLQNCERKPSKIVTTLATIFSAVEEGFNKCERYRRWRASRTANLLRSAPVKTGLADD